MRAAVARHYDSLSLLYRCFWGEHIHHGYWAGPGTSVRQAQEQLVAHLADRAAISRGEAVLDIGCGYGASGRWLAQYRSCDVTGVTISRKQARFARSRNVRVAGPRPTVVRADAAHLPIRPRSFDVVWVIECIEHLDDKPGFLRTAASCLRAGGRLALCSWQRGSAAGPEARRRVQRVCQDFLCPSLASAREYRRWCELAGLRVGVQEDLTDRVGPTWEILQERVSRPWVVPLRWVVGAENRRLADSFPIIAEAFATRAMTYGLLVAVKS